MSMRDINIKIIVCCHKPDIMATQDPYFPIQVGCDCTDLRLGVQCDNEGDNISSKNPHYCELTGIYWAWKNIKDVDIIGVAHYRRYFDFHNQCDPVYPFTCFKTEDFSRVNLSIPSHLLNRIKDGTAVVIKPRYYPTKLSSLSRGENQKYAMTVLEQHILSTQPKDIQRAWYKVMHRGRKFHYCNMCIMTKSDFDAYCEWLFDILSKMENLLNLKNEGDKFPRILGFHAEYLLDVYLCAKKFKLKEYPLLLFSDDDVNARSNIRSYIKYVLKIVKIYINAIKNK